MCLAYRLPCGLGTYLSLRTSRFVLIWIANPALSIFPRNIDRCSHTRNLYSAQTGWLVECDMGPTGMHIATPGVASRENKKLHIREAPRRNIHYGRRYIYLKNPQLLARDPDPAVPTGSQRPTFNYRAYMVTRRLVYYRRFTRMRPIKGE